MTWLVDSDNDDGDLGCQQFSHLCDVSVLLNRVTSFATRTNKGCGQEDETRNTAGDASIGGIVADIMQQGQEILSTTEQSAISNPNLFLALSVISSFVLGLLLTCCVDCICTRRPREKQRCESELVLNTDEEEPDIVID